MKTTTAITTVKRDVKLQEWMEQTMDAKTLSMILGHTDVAFTLNTYTHVLDSHKREGMKLMEELFAPPVLQQNQTYPVVVSVSSNGYIMNAVDFEDLCVEADNIQNGLSCIQTAITQKIAGTFPPAPTPHNDIIVQPGEFFVVVNV